MALSNDSRLDYKPLQVLNLFSSTSYYVVPSYQRGYSWTTSEIQELLSDLDDAFSSYPEEEYLLGQIIVCPTSSERPNMPRDVSQWDLIDGQQRCTTLYLFLLRSLQKVETDLSLKKLELSRADLGKLKEWDLTREVIDLKDQVIPRIKAAANGEYFLDQLLQGNLISSPEGPTQVNMYAAVEEIDTALGKLSPKEVFEFLRFVVNQVWVVRLGLNTPEHALRVFQKVNNRGLQLDDADLIKSYLFQSVKSDDSYTNLSRHWETATIVLSKARNKRLKPMENLMKMLIGVRTGKSISKGALYDAWVKELQTEESVTKLALNLESDASNLVTISQGKIPSDSQKSDLIQGVMDAGWIQPYEILLAGSHLEPDSYKNLLKLVEDRTMLSFWSKEKNNTFEAIIHPWAKAVASLDPYATFEDIREASAKATEDLPDLLKRAFLGIQSLSYSYRSHRPRMRYILARAHNIFQELCDVTPPSIESLMKTPSGEESGYHLDHIFPQSESRKGQWSQNLERDLAEGSASRYLKSIHSIGNLVLLHPDDNLRQSDALPWDEDKQINLGKSELYLNRVLAAEEFWPKVDSRIANVLAALQKKYDLISNTKGCQEDRADALAALYWEVISEKVRVNFGITN